MPRTAVLSPPVPISSGVVRLFDFIDQQTIPAVGSLRTNSAISAGVTLDARPCRRFICGSAAIELQFIAVDLLHIERNYDVTRDIC